VLCRDDDVMVRKALRRACCGVKEKADADSKPEVSKTVRSNRIVLGE